MGSGPECPYGCSSRLSAPFGWVGGVCMKPSGGKTALHTNHYCSSVAATQPLIYSTALFGRDVDTQSDTHTYTHTHLQKHISLCIRMVGRKLLRNTVVWGGMCCCFWVGQCLQINTHNSSWLKSVFSIKFSHLIPVYSFDIGEDCQVSLNMTEKCCFSDTQIPTQYLSGELFMTATPPKLYVAY